METVRCCWRGRSGVYCEGSDVLTDQWSDEPFWVAAGFVAGFVVVAADCAAARCGSKAISAAAMIAQEIRAAAHLENVMLRPDLAGRRNGGRIF